MSEYTNAIRNLETIPVPADVSRVEDCNCGGLDFHRQDCTLWNLPHETVLANLDAARERVSDFTISLNKELHAWLRAQGQA